MKDGVKEFAAVVRRNHDTGVADANDRRLSGCSLGCLCWCVFVLVPHGNAASVKVPPGQLWTCHVAEAEADMMSGPEMYTQRGDSSLSTGWIVTMTVIWICSRSTTCEGQTVHRFPATTCTTKTSMETGHGLRRRDGQRDLRRDAPD